MLKMNTGRVNKALNEAIRLLDKQIEDTQKTMQEIMTLVDAMTGDDE